MPNPVHDIPRHPKTGAYASGKIEFRAIAMRDDNGETIITSGISPAKFTTNGAGFTIDLPEGLLESRLRIDGGTKTEWENGRFVNPPGGGRYLDLIQAFTGVPEDPSALEALYAVLANTYAPIGAVDPTALYKQLARTPEVLIAGSITRDVNGAATSAPVAWPDGTVGTYTATTLSSAFPGAVDAYAITYGSPVTHTYTQPAVTRDASGAATAVPAIVVS